MEPRGRRSPRLGPLGSWPPHGGAGGGPCLAALCGRAFLTNGRPVSPRVDVCLNHGSDSVRVLCRILGTLSRPSSCITVSIVMLMVPRDLRSYTLIDWGHLELPAQSQHLDGHISVCSDCPLASWPLTPCRGPPCPLRCSSRKWSDSGLRVLTRGKKSHVLARLTEHPAPHILLRPALRVGTPPSQDSERLASYPAPRSFLCVLHPPGCPLSLDSGLAGHSSESPGEAKPASGAEFASPALPWSLQPPCWASPWWPAAAPPVSGLSEEQGGAGVQRQHSERRG